MNHWLATTRNLASSSEKPMTVIARKPRFCSRPYTNSKIKLHDPKSTTKRLWRKQLRESMNSRLGCWSNKKNLLL
jgi:hypothetical protein